MSNEASFYQRLTYRKKEVKAFKQIHK